MKQYPCPECNSSTDERNLCSVESFELECPECGHVFMPSSKPLPTIVQDPAVAFASFRAKYPWRPKDDHPWGKLTSYPYIRLYDKAIMIDVQPDHGAPPMPCFLAFAEDSEINLSLKYQDLKSASEFKQLKPLV
jgi:hypothetical protein